MKSKFKKYAGKITCVALAFILALSVPSTVFANAAASTEKDETVYVNMDADGNVLETIVSDWLHSDTPIAQIPDKSNLKNIQNVKSCEKPAKNGDSLTWMLNSSSKDSSGSNIYYKGNTDKKPPLNVSVSYFLNGKQISAKDLAGKSGKVKINIKIKNTDKHIVKINGKDVEMYTPMTAFLIAALPSETFKNVELSDGKLFSDGNTQMATFVTMPGMNESLNLDGYDIDAFEDIDYPEELEITADAEEFELSSIAIAATPELKGIDEIKDSDDIDEMKTNLNKLKNMQDDIELADPDKDIRALFTNPDKTASARLLVDDVFDFYDMDKALADILPDYVTNDNISLYDKVTSDLDRADIKYILDNEVLRGVNDRLTDENIQKSKLLVEDYDEIQTFRMSKLDDLIDIMDDYDDMYDDIDDLLGDARKAVNRVFYDKDNVDTLEKLSSNRDIKSGIRDLVGSLKTLSGMAKTYGVNLSDIDEEDIKSILIPIVEKMAGDKAGKQISTQIDGLLEKYPQLKVGDDKISTMGLLGVLDKMKDLPEYSSLLKIPDVGNLIKGWKKDVHENPKATIEVKSLKDTLKDIAINYADTNVNNIADSIAEQICDVIKSAGKIQKGMEKEEISFGDLSEIANGLQRAVPMIKEIKDDIDDLDREDLEDTLDKTEDFVLDEDNMHYMKDWAHKIRDMKKDMDDNSENVEIMRDLLKEYDDPKVKNFKDMMSILQDDLDETRPIVEALKDDLDIPVYNASLHKSPDTVARLLKIKDDVIEKRNIVETLRLATSPNTTKLFKNTFDRFDELKADDCVDDYIKKVNDADELLARKDEFVNLSDNYDIFTQAADGASTKLKFVMKTEEIEIPEVEDKTVEVKETKQDFFSWCKTAIQKAANKISHIFG